MEGTYPILQNRKPVGQVQVLRQGLYYRFICRCAYHGDSICRLTVQCSDESVGLGVMVPEGDVFTLDRRFPVKTFGQGEPEFFIPTEEPEQEVQGERGEQEVGLFVPISTEEPFGYIARLKDAFLTYRNGKLGAWIPEKK